MQTLNPVTRQQSTKNLGESPWLRLIEVENSLRQASDEAAFSLTLVNGSGKLISSDRAVLFTLSGAHSLSVTAVSGVSDIERNAPYIQNLQRLASRVQKENSPQTPEILTGHSFFDSFEKGSGTAQADYLLWIPLIHPNGQQAGVLLLEKTVRFSNHEVVLAKQLAGTAAHCWQACNRNRSGFREKLFQRPVLWSVGLLLFAVLWLPVRLTVLAPAEVVAAQPRVYTAPLSGVIQEILVEPNAQVEEGQPLIRFEDTELRNRVNLAGEELAVATAELRKSQQGAFLDNRSAAQLAELKARVDLKSAEYRYSKELLARTLLVAKAPGIAVFRDKDDWSGKPVKTGEHILYLASPERVKLTIELPVRDAISLDQGTEISFFLDSQPLSPVQAVLSQSSYEADVTPDGILAYTLKAKLDSGQSIPRIGMRGVAKLYGDETSLFMYLFRRPLTFARQWLGV